MCVCVNNAQLQSVRKQTSVLFAGNKFQIWLLSKLHSKEEVIISSETIKGFRKNKMQIDWKVRETEMLRILNKNKNLTIKWDTNMYDDSILLFSLNKLVHNSSFFLIEI